MEPHDLADSDPVARESALPDEECLDGEDDQGHNHAPLQGHGEEAVDRDMHQHPQRLL